MSNRAELYFPDEITQHTVLRRTRSSTPTRLSFCQWLFDILFCFPGAAAIKHNLSSCLWLNFSFYAKQQWLFDILSNFRFPSTHLQLDLPQFQCWFAWKIVLALNSISLVVTCYIQKTWLFCSRVCLTKVIPVHQPGLPIHTTHCW